MVFTLNANQLNAFASNNQSAMMLMFQGASDYIGCRCCLLNGVFSGLELGEQAVEKHLKAMVLFALPQSTPRKFGHNLIALWKLVIKDGIADLSIHAETIQRLQSHYRARYPDNTGRSTFASTREIQDIDNLMIDILEKMPIPEEVLLRSGVYSRFLDSIERGFYSHEAHWLLSNNDRLLAKLPSLIQRHKEWLSFSQ